MSYYFFYIVQVSNCLLSCSHHPPIMREEGLPLFLLFHGLLWSTCSFVAKLLGEKDPIRD